MSLFPRYVRPDENWVRTATLTATSADVGYEAPKAGDDDPARPWWATSGTATLTLTLTGVKAIGIVSLVQPTIDAGRAITITGTGGTGFVGASAGDVRLSGYPRNVAYEPAAGITSSAVTIAVAGNTQNIAIGEVVIGAVRTFGFPIEPGRGRRQIVRDVIDDNADNTTHTIRYDVGSQWWSLTTEVHANDAAFAELEDWYDATRFGVLPTLVQVHPLEEWRLCRMDRSVGWSHTRGELREAVTFNFTEIGRGVVVQ